MEHCSSYPIIVNHSSLASSKCDQCSGCSSMPVSSCSCNSSSQHGEFRCYQQQHTSSSSSSSLETHSWVEELKTSSSCDTMHKYKANQNNKRFTLVDFPTNPPVFTQQAEQKKRRLPGSRSSRFVVFLLFTICVLGAIAAFFCWPRTPRVSVGGGADALTGPDWDKKSLKATWQINVTMDNRDNWIPTHMNRIDLVIEDSLTLIKFAWATPIGPLVLAPGTITPISVIFNVNYQAPSDIDPTFQDLRNACGPELQNGQRPALNVLVKVSFHIFGILWTPMVTATPYTGGLLCPIK